MEAIADFQELQNLPTHEKVIWLKNTLDKNTRNITLGANEIMVSRDSLVQDAMAQFAVMCEEEDPKKVL